MGCDIHIDYEKRVDGKWEDVCLDAMGNDSLGYPIFPFDWRSYYMYGHFAGVRNVDVPRIDDPRGIPEDSPQHRGIPDDGGGYGVELYYEHDFHHSASHIYLHELKEFDYDQLDEPYYGDVDGPKVTMRENLGPWFFRSIEYLERHGIERIVFAFDN